MNCSKKRVEMIRRELTGRIFLITNRKSLIQFFSIFGYLLAGGGGGGAPKEGGGGGAPLPGGGGGAIRPG